jgi:hypothetical protein
MVLTTIQSQRLDKAIELLTPASDKPLIIPDIIAELLAPFNTVLGVNQTTLLELLKDRPTLTLLRLLRELA